MVFFAKEDQPVNPVKPVHVANITTRLDLHTDTHATALELLRQLEEDCPTTINIRLVQSNMHVVIDEHYVHPKDSYSSLYFLTTFPITGMEEVQQ